MGISRYTEDMLSIWNDRGINLQGFIWGGSISYHLVQELCICLPLLAPRMQTPFYQNCVSQVRQHPP